MKRGGLGALKKKIKRRCIHKCGRDLKLYRQ